MINICPTQLLLGQVENHPFIVLVLYASDSTVVDLIPQDSNP